MKAIKRKQLIKTTPKKKRFGLCKWTTRLFSRTSSDWLLNGLFNGCQAEQRLRVGDSAPYRFRCLSSEQMAERARCTVAANCSINYIISNTLLPVSFSCKQQTCLMFWLCMIHPTSSRSIICHQISFTLFVTESWKYSFLQTSRNRIDHFNLILAKTREYFCL